MAIFAERTGIDLLHVPYRGGSAMVNGLLTGEIQVGWSGIPNVMALIESGKLRGYCVSVLQRSPSTPSIPTCDELGQKGFDVATVMGLHAPAGTSPKVVARLQAEVAKTMREPAMAARMKQLGMVMEENGTANYVQFMKYDMDRYAAGGEEAQSSDQVNAAQVRLTVRLTSVPQSSQPKITSSRSDANNTGVTCLTVMRRWHCRACRMLGLRRFRSAGSRRRSAARKGLAVVALTSEPLLERQSREQRSLGPRRSK